MKYCFIFILFLTLLLSSCKKTIDYSGTVYSKHHIAMPGVDVLATYISENGRRKTSYGAITNAKGQFVLSVKIPARQTIDEITITTQDSGSYRSITDGVESWHNPEIILQ